MVRFFDNSIVTEPGSPIRVLYKPVVDKKGNIELEECGKENTQEIIQSYAESCDIQLILKNAMMGDVSGLQKVQGVYGDFTQMPKTYAEMLQLQIDAKNAFNGLPPDVKKQFDNDYNKFLMSAGESEWMEKLGINSTLNINDPKESSEAANGSETGKGEA